jgi:hypothetical protein
LRSADVRRGGLAETIGFVKEFWAEFDYAQRRLLEVQLGVPMVRSERPKVAQSIGELEALYAFDDPRHTD